MFNCGAQLQDGLLYSTVQSHRKKISVKKKKNAVVFDQYGIKRKKRENPHSVNLREKQFSTDSTQGLAGGQFKFLQVQVPARCALQGRNEFAAEHSRSVFVATFFRGLEVPVDECLVQCLWSAFYLFGTAHLHMHKRTTLQYNSTVQYQKKGRTPTNHERNSI